VTRAPIALFVYNRPEHTRRTVEALKGNTQAKESVLIVFSDAPKSEAQVEKVREVREYIQHISGFKSVSVVARETNFGLARSIIDGVTMIVNKYGQIIVLEDDIVTSSYFLQFMNDALATYENEEKVISIHGYTLPIPADLPETFFLRDPGCWGWATWKRGWDQFESNGSKLRELIKKAGLVNEFNFSGSSDYLGMLEDQIMGRNDSWAVRWYASAFLLNKLTLYPGISLAQNIGNDGSGQHCGETDQFLVELAVRPVRVGGGAVEENKYVRSELIKYLMSISGSRIRKLARRIRRTIYRATSYLRKMS
jgi:hypothetical protein